MTVTIKHREIYWVEFPLPDGTRRIAKRRPALIIQARNVYPDARVVIPFTSKNSKYVGIQSVLFVKKTPQNGLPKDSTLLIFQIIPIKVVWIKDRLGELSDTDFEQLRTKLRDFFGI